MWPTMDIDLDNLRLRTLTEADAPAVVEATSAETEPSFWGPRPVGPYSLAEAKNALREWDPDSDGQVSFGAFSDNRLVGALGLMPDAPQSAELAYWVRPEWRRRGIALRGITAVTQWAHEHAQLPRVWLEIRPDNAPSLRLAERAGFTFEERLAHHCRSWTADDPGQDTWHDCLIWSHTVLE
ncbi:GNAT family N-acetyltransferase [Stackebrandtia nassauensis]|uniref:GCN5-related N-acetyltransferase n=1 Tax=Stackebrandtia nassauensis (strain DSM 44728 / CIP 108903 / NRRL B-16338 / NBRC 102104 / LLR-40K-21) TaxID=446470 RepID=D3Q8D7_STANL|nr:GNAT family N-acetyltransferase [Stackebrandtia nassauensis]ADD42511.1 GCN5-related N-acetyltransferase [Stackebrandtia nassauensis DSM 44728]